MKKIAGELCFNRFVVPYRVYGNGQDTILCLSGAKQTMSAWRSFVSYFQKDFRIIVFDMPGQGRAKVLSGSNRITLDEQIEIVHALVGEIGLHQNAESFIVGGSWGSIVAAAYAARYPDVFTRLALGSFGTKPNVVLKQVIDDVKETIASGNGKAVAPIMIERFGQQIPDSLKRMIVSQFESMSEEQYLSLYEHAVFVTEMADLNDYIDLSKIKVKTLVVMGQHDTIMDLFDAKRASEKIPSCEYIVVKGAGHFLHWEREEILDVYRAFFTREDETSESLLRLIAN